MSLPVALQALIPLPQCFTRSEQVPGGSLSCLGEGVDTEAPLAKLWDFIKVRGSQVHNLHSANTEHTLRARKCARCQDLKQRAGQMQWGVAGARLEHGMGSECPQPVPRVSGGGGEDCGS